jgi:hypothetical protein
MQASAVTQRNHRTYQSCASRAGGEAVCVSTADLLSSSLSACGPDSGKSSCGSAPSARFRPISCRRNATIAVITAAAMRNGGVSTDRSFIRLLPPFLRTSRCASSAAVIDCAAMELVLGVRGKSAVPASRVRSGAASGCCQVCWASLGQDRETQRCPRHTTGAARHRPRASWPDRRSRQSRADGRTPRRK